jgi:hypothetical protein
MNELASLAAALVEADRNVDVAELELKKAKEHARTLREETLPMAMQELGLSDVKLATGEKIVVKQDVYLAVPAERKEEAWAWLEDHGFGGLIKTEVKAAFGRGEVDAALGVLSGLRAEGVDAVLKRDVHAQTLKAWAREQIAAGADLPMDLFGARPVWTTQIK